VVDELALARLGVVLLQAGIRVLLLLGVEVKEKKYINIGGG
jgi:hypothetical protein